VKELKVRHCGRHSGVSASLSDGKESMDTTFVILTVAWVIVVYLLSRLFRAPVAPQVTQEQVDGATVEKCPRCESIIGVSLKESVTWRISKQDKCPHCNSRIKR
jgi:hypothetical protein